MSKLPDRLEALKRDVIARIGGSQLIAYIASLGHSYKPSGGEYKILCPFHADTRPSMGINTRKRETGLIRCYSCGWGTGDIFEFVGDLYGLEKFTDQLKKIAGDVGLGEAVGGGEVKREWRPVVRQTEAVPVMTAQEVLAEYRALKETQLEPKKWMDDLGVSVDALRMIGGFVCPLPWAKDRTVLVVPQRDALGNLCSLRFRDFLTKKRWGLDQKRWDEAERAMVQEKRTTAGLMAMPEEFDPEFSVECSRRFVIEGETDLLGGLTILLRDYPPDPAEWPIRFVAVPGVMSCHDHLLSLRPAPLTVVFFDGDQAARMATFDHRSERRPRENEDPKAGAVEVRDGVFVDLDSPRVPGLLTKFAGAGHRCIAASPPRRENKYDLRDMCRDGWRTDQLIEHCLRHGTSDRTGLSSVQREVVAS